MLRKLSWCLVVSMTAFLAACAATPATEAFNPNAPIDTAAFKEKIKVACVGDSITANGGNNAYPQQLGRMLGEKWEVRNFGAGGRTLMNKGDHPYQTEGKLQPALEFKPDVVVIMLGTNDSKPFNWKFKDTFVADYKELVEKFHALEKKPRIFVMLPPPVVGAGAFSIKQENLDEAMPMISGVAKEMKLGLIDVYAPLKGKDEMIPDKVHPNAKGAEVMAKMVFQDLTGKAYEGPTTVK